MEAPSHSDLCPSSATCVTTLPQPCATFATSTTSGLTLYSNSLYIGFSDSSYSLSTQLLRNSMTSTPTVNAYCGGASANVTNNGATCAAIAFKAPQSLIVGSLFHLAHAVRARTGQLRRALRAHCGQRGLAGGGLAAGLCQPWLGLAPPRRAR